MLHQRLHTSWLLATGLAITQSLAAAPVLQVNGDGQLTGAQGVQVAGSLYDVAFVDGQCRDAVLGYFGDTPQCEIFFTRFAFNTPALAIAASQALLDQVFIDGLVVMARYDFDTDPALTAGCEGDRCSVFSPYAVKLWVGYDDMRLPKIYYEVQLAFATNQAQGADAVTALLRRNAADTTVGVPDQVWARWKPAAAVAEPSTLALLMAGLAGGLAGLAAQRRPCEV
jgi:hypothetical protein